MRRNITALVLIINLVSALAYMADTHADDKSIAKIETPKSLPVAPVNGGESFILELDPPLQFPEFKFTELQIVFVEYPLYIFGINGRLTDTDTASSTINGTCEWRVEVERLSCDLRFSNFLLNILTDIDLVGSLQICSITDAECITKVDTSRAESLLSPEQESGYDITSVLCQHGSLSCLTNVRVLK